MYSLKGSVYDNIHPADVLYKLQGPNSDDGQSTSNLPVPDTNATTSLTNASANGAVGSLTDRLQAVTIVTDNLVKAIDDFTAEQKQTASKLGKVADTRVKVKAVKAAIPKRVDTGPYFCDVPRKDFKIRVFNNASRSIALPSFTLANFPSLLENVVLGVPKPFAFLVQGILGSRKHPNNIEVQFTAKTLNVKGMTLKPYQVLEFLGVLTGLYDPKNVNLADTDFWLKEIIQSVPDVTSLDHLVRTANIHLGPNDLLTNLNQVSLADVALYYTVCDVKYLPNNVELFIKRVEEALSTA